jgi:hypothetical protein
MHTYTATNKTNIFATSLPGILLLQQPTQLVRDDRLGILALTLPLRVLPINDLDRPLEPVKEDFGADKRRVEINRHTKIVDVLQHLVESLQMLYQLAPNPKLDTHHNLLVSIQNRERDEDMELPAQCIRPQDFP